MSVQTAKETEALRAETTDLRAETAELRGAHEMSKVGQRKMVEELTRVRRDAMKACAATQKQGGEVSAEVKSEVERLSKQIRSLREAAKHNGS